MGNYVHAAGMSPPGIDDFCAVYTWLPGNLFSGPTHRPGGDPGDHFDSFASRCVDEGRYLDVLRAHQAIQAYLGQNRGAGFADTAARSARPCPRRPAGPRRRTGPGPRRHLRRADAE